MPDSSPEQPHAQRPLAASAHTLLSQSVIVRVSGPKASQFLHGQFSQSLDEVTDIRSPRAAACNPKGRTYALTRLVRHGEDFLFALPRSLTEATLAHLNKYLMLFRGTQMTVAEDAYIIGLLGDRIAEQLLPGAVAQLAHPGDTAVIDHHRLIRTQDTAEGLHRFEFWQCGALSDEQAANIGSAQEVSETDWQASEIAAGVASLIPDTQDAYVPQMLNWQHVDGVHFKKGCYTGQEVIARMHFLGQLKKSLFRLRADNISAPPKSGQAVQVGERTVGNVVNAVMFDDGSAELLAVLRHDGANGDLTLGDKIPLSLLGLPYAVPERESTAGRDT